jgi:hypothetical protein
MPSNNTLTVVKSADVVFDDVYDLNEDLEINTRVGELVEFIREPGPAYVGFIKSNPERKAVVTSKGENDMFSGYADHALVWGCFDMEVAGIISRHMTSGSMTLRLDREGNGSTIYEIVPNQISVVV